MSTLLHANTELVAVTWLGGVTGLLPSMVATTLPTDNTTWSASGFVTVRTTGGRPVTDNPLRQPVVTVDTWACKPTSSKPPWGQAANLADTIVRGCYAVTDAERAAIKRTLTLPGNFPPARVHSVLVVAEPRRSYADVGDYASYTLSLELHWTEG